MEMRLELGHWTADEVAECLPLYDDALYIKLWGFVGDAASPTPLGGDGTNGTVEYPDGRLSPHNDDKTPHWWGKLSEEEQQKIDSAYRRQVGD